MIHQRWSRPIQSFHRRLLSTAHTYSRQQNQNQNHNQPLSFWWIGGMAGSCVLQERYYSTSTSTSIATNTIATNTTLAEKRPDAASTGSGTGSGTGTSNNKHRAKKEAKGNYHEKEINPRETSPWYRRYPTQAFESIRHPSLLGLRSFSGDTHAHGGIGANGNGNGNGDRVETQRNNNNSPLDNTTLFHGQCLNRQLWKPSVPYPAWDYNWDGKMADHWSTLETLSTTEGLQNTSRTGTTRHILLIRHGQYNEEPLDDRKRSLTALGRRQAQLTGKRLAQMVNNIGPEHVRSITTSDLLRAKQTAFIIAKQLPGDTIPINNPDADLNEGLPAPMIPSRPDMPDVVEEIDDQTERMDRAFHKYFHRADLPVPLQEALEALIQQEQDRINSQQQQEQLHHQQHQPEQDFAISTSGTISMVQTHEMIPSSTSSTTSSSTLLGPKLLPLEDLKLPLPDHEFDIVVCHGNVIRYFLCRALQIPPEAWLRLSVFNCSISYVMIKPNGYVSCRMIGDIGHLGYKETTFSGAHGLLWS